MSHHVREEASRAAWRVEFLFVAAIVLAPRVLALRALPIFDDAFITFRYAQHFAQGYGLVYNLHSRVLGTTTPLFAVLLGVFVRFGIEPPSAARLIAITADLFTGVLSYSLLKTAFGRLSATASLAAFASAPYILRISLGGMEASLFLATSLLVIFLLSRDHDEELAFLLAAITVYLRPEGIILCGFAAIRSVTQRRQKNWAALAVGVMVLVAPVLVIWLWYGNAIPSSVAAKARRVNGPFFSVLQPFFFPQQADWGVQTLLTVLGAFAVPSMWRQSRFCRWLLTWVGFYVLAYLIVRPPIYSWYALPVFFVESMAAGFSMAALVKMLVGRKIEIGSAASAGVFAIGAVFWTSVAHTIGVAPMTRNIYEPLHLWCARHVHPTDKIAASDIGAIGYYSDAYIYDLAGLVWPEVFQYKNVYAAILAKRPKFVFANVTSGSQEMFDANSELGRLYEPVARFARSGSKDVVPQPDVFTPGWQQDYVMFQRRGDPPSATQTRPQARYRINLKPEPACQSRRSLIVRTCACPSPMEASLF